MKADQTKVELLDRVIAHARSRLAADQLERFTAFVAQYYEHLATDDLVQRSVIDLYGAALAHLHLVQQRQPGHPKVRVYNPSFDEHGWQSTHTAVQIVTDDMPFLVDSMSMELNRNGYGIRLIVHPIIWVRRDPAGELIDLRDPLEPGPDAHREAVLHFEVARVSDPERLRTLKPDLLRVLADVRAAYEDWPHMRAHAIDIVRTLPDEPTPVPADDVAEARALLDWMADDHFTFLGYREYELAEVEGEDVLRSLPGTGLGILRDEDDHPSSHSFAKLPPDVRRKAREPVLLTITKANSKATVHRPTYMDYLGVKRFDADGRVIGERRFLGLWTAWAYNTTPMDIPILRRKVVQVLQMAGFPPASHSRRELQTILETYPRDELFQISVDDLFRVALGIHNLQERQRVRLFVRRDDFGRFFSCLVYVPRDNYTTTVVSRIEEILAAAYGARSVEHTTRISESVLARLHLVVYVDPTLPVDVDVAEVEARLAEAARSWSDDLAEALMDQHGEEEGLRLLQRWSDAFPAAYREDVNARTAVGDIRRLEELDRGQDLVISIHHPIEAAENYLRFRLFRLGEPISLSAVLPLLEHMGVRVIDEHPYEIWPASGDVRWVYDFGITSDDLSALEGEEQRTIFCEAFARLFRGEVENDGFNRQVLRAGLGWREVSVVRAYAKYLRQAGTTFSQAYIEQTLAANPHVARLLVDLFLVRFSPATGPGGADRQTELVNDVHAALAEVASLDEDRILSSLLALVLATTRTNYFQRTPEGQTKPYLSLKLDPSRVPDLPLPRPMYEIWVYSPRVEGVHIRGGRVARGGIRWSDRREDFRTEILGLMKAQMVKNAVIVPTGAKGGFVVKRPPAGADRDALMAEVVGCYQTLIRGLLDVTDNLVGDTVVPPADVVRYDGDDTYLVVAADKGTATFSDIANDIAIEYGFWLGDAFASGGSSGYDHKKMGITAKGAWESVRRHFRVLGLDVANHDFTVVGIGDMSGDVFGNAMLLSDHIRLIGAFDHRHVFLDPNPDPVATFAERKRLFDLPRSSWDDFDRSVMSAGGGVWPRSAKSIPLSPEVRAALDISATSLTPNEVISAILAAPVDLLWNGGIGTYVKASTETHAEVGDRANDGVRVDGNALRCRAVGEGGNLGFTQRGRVEYSLAGGLINTDAIDNSAGVDCSDHEVNIKILLDAVVASGDLTEKQRNQLLAEMTDEVAALVLRDNYEQTRALANARAQAASMVDVHARYIRSLENEGLLNRALEFLPSEKQLADRQAAGIGLTAAEMSVLLAYTKITNLVELLDSDVPEDPALAPELERYFPTPLRERYRDRMAGHRLRREIVATRVSNTMANKAGISFDFRMTEETGASVPDVTRAYIASREIFRLLDVWAEVEALDGMVDADAQISMLLDLRRAVERGTLWLLRHRRPTLDVTATIAAFGEGVTSLAEHLPHLLFGSDRDRMEASVARLVAARVPQELAARVAGYEAQYSAFDIVEVARARGRSVVDAGAVFFALTDRLGLDWLRDRIIALPRDVQWATLARAALRDDVGAAQRELTADVLRAADPALDAYAVVDGWIALNHRPVDRLLAVLAEIRSGTTHDITTLSVGLRELRNLIVVASPF